LLGSISTRRYLPEVQRRQEPSLAAALLVLGLLLCWSQNWLHLGDAYNFVVNKVAQHAATSVQHAVEHAASPSRSARP
jgi:hypothetical protein